MNRIWHGAMFLALGLAVTTAHAMSKDEAALIAASANRGNANAEVLLAGIYLRGEAGYPHDDGKAAYWYERAAEQGNAYAQRMIGEFYVHATGVEQNLKVAADWLEKSANRGNNEAQLELGKMYLYGDGVPADPQLAARWLERAAVEGNGEAQYLYAKLFQTGIGVEKNDEIAGNWLAKSAAQGYRDALILEHALENIGYRVEETFYNRLPELTQLAQDGDVEAQYQLARQLETGANGKPKDAKAAVKWFGKAAEHGHVLAMRELATIYKNGLDTVPADAAEARRWNEKLSSNTSR